MKTSELMKRVEAGFKGTIKNLAKAGSDPVALNSATSIDIDAIDDWDIVYKTTSITFVEAVAAYAVNKIIKCELNGKATVYDHINANGVPIAGDYMVESTHTYNPWGYITHTEILNGVWYASE